MEETTMMAERENRAWHVAGHAYAAMLHGCRVHKLSLNGFSALDLENREDAKCLDAWTMIEPPRSFRPVGTFQYTHAMEQLMHIAIAGPVVELSHRRLPCVLENVRQFTDDWHQAWTAAGYLHDDETMRLELLRRRIHNSPAVIFYGLSEFYDNVTLQLLEHGVLSGDQAQAAWDQMKAAQEAALNCPLSRRRSIMSEPPHPEAIGDLLIPPEFRDT
jgi:hypothetical protein